jgi:LysM repeat protein
MTPTHAPAPTRTRRTPGDIIRGLAAVIALATFVIGVPIALLTVAPWSFPETWPTWSVVVEALTRPDDGTLLLGVIQLIAWVAWAAFTISVITELAAATRHVNVPRLPLLGGAQRLAATLVTTAGLLIVTSAPSISTATAAESVVATTPAGPVPGSHPYAPASSTVRAPATPTPAAQHATVTTTGPTVVVQRGDTLWDLAERHLGDGHRYTEILDLNLGRQQTDGRALDDAHWIYPGWRLLLPHDAMAPEHTTHAPTTSVPDDAYMVEPGDTLWDIAAERLGDPHRYPEIVDLNLGVPQPDGGMLTDADVIEPGWRLALPASHGAAAGVATTPDPIREPSDEPEQVAEGSPTRPPVDDGSLPVDDATAPADDADTGIEERAAPADDVRPDTDDATSVSDDVLDDADASSSPHTFYLGLTALAAAGVIGELARRRKLQQRARRTGKRIALPAEGSPARDAERTLRDAVPPLTISALKQALLNLASRCYTAERDLPRLAAITLTSAELVLHLAEDDPDAVEPFTGTGSRTWSASHAALVADADIDDPGRPEPYPALVTLGHTVDGTVLLNLEAAGTLTLTGDPDAAADVLRALVAELATSDLTGRIGLIAGPEFAALAAACATARLQTTTAGSLNTLIAQRGTDVTHALRDAGVDDTLQARSDRTVGDLWLPVVYVTTDVPTRAAPWSGSAVIGVGRPTADAWTMNVDADHATLAPLDLAVRPQRLSEADLGDLVGLLTTANQTDGDDPAGAEPSMKEEIADALTAIPAPATVTEGAAETPALLRINVLGPISIEGVVTGDDTHLSRRSTELLVYLALRGQATGPELDEALWHGQRIDNQTRNSLVYRTRQRVGAEVLPIVGPDGLYRLGHSVSCDWTEFQTLAHRGLTAGPDGVEDLQAALNLVRDRPLVGVRDRDYTWAEHDIQHAISTIADVAHVLSRHRTLAGELHDALGSATKGLRADACSELLVTDAITAAEGMGDADEVDRLIARLVAAEADIDPESVVLRRRAPSRERMS